MISEIFGNFENIIILYAPTVLVYIAQFIDWFVTLKTFKALNIGRQIAPVISEIKSCTDEVKALNNRLDKFDEDKASLATSILKLEDTIKEQRKEIEDLKGYLKNVTHENVELKATLRRKESKQ